MLWSRQAFAEAQAAGRVKTREWIGYAPNGIKFHGYIDDKGSGVVSGFYVDF
jgi:hypothetical protein